MRPKTNRLLMLLIGAMLAGCASQTERSSSGGGAEQAQAPAPTPAPAPAYEPQGESVQFVDRPLKAPEQPLPDFPVTKYEIEEEVEDLGTQPDESGTMQFPEETLAAKESVVSAPTEVADEPEEEVGDLGTQPDESGTMSYPEQQLASEKVISEPTQYADQVKVAFEAEPLFSFDKSAVRSDQSSKLDQFVASLKGTQYDSISVIGYADRIGSEDYNQKLSERRANAAKNYLVRQGIPAGKITAVGRGESEPVTGDTCSGQRGKALIACLEPDRRADVSVNATKASN
ncbi:MAG: OmpA family protein [Burkholderiales bacterium]